MNHDADLILTLTGALTAALFLGFLTQKLRLSPIVGYLLAGICVGPFTPGFVADNHIATQCAEIGVILLMFGIGLHFRVKDLLSVKTIAIPGAIIQIIIATCLGALIARAFGWPWTSGIVFGVAISVASTVVLIRVLSDNRALHTPIGRIAVGWLVVEDLFTVVALVLLPMLFGSSDRGALWTTLGIALLKLAVLVVFALTIGQKVIPLLLGYVARTGSRELFTLSVLVLALGIAVGAASFFGASMALGAFLAGIVVGQSEYGARAASDALPMRDAFAVLFFVSVGMLFDPSAIAHGWPLMLATLSLVLIGKPLVAMGTVLLLGRPLRSALSISVALSQIGEFSFILASVASAMHVLPAAATDALVVTSIVSIVLNPLLYRCVEPFMLWLERKKLAPAPKPRPEVAIPVKKEATHRTLVVGYGPVGRTMSRLLREKGIEVIVIEMNIVTVQELRARGEHAVYGDAAQRDILSYAGIEKADSLIIAASGLPTRAIVQAAHELNPKIEILTRVTYLREIDSLYAAGARDIFSSEGEVALAMTEFLMRKLGATSEQIESERFRIREELFVNMGN